MWLCVCENIMKHFTACNIKFPEYRRLTLFSWVMTILTSWKGLCGYDRDDMFCQDFCTVRLLRTFPSHYSICKQHVIPVVQHLHVVFYCFLIFLWLFHWLGILLWEFYYIFYGPQPLQFPLIVHYIYMSCGASAKTICVFLRLWSMVTSCWKSTSLFLFILHLYSSTSDAEPGKAYRWRGAPVPCVCWYTYLQTSSQANIVSRPLSQWVFGTISTGTTLETGAWNLVW